MVSFGAAIKLGFKNAFKFGGVATRAEYWWFFLFGYILNVVANLVDAMLGIDTVLGGIGDVIGGPVSVAAAFVLFVPQLSILVRRFRDTRVSPLWLITGLIPVVGLVTWLTNHYADFTRIVYLAATDDPAATDAFVNELVNDSALAQSFAQLFIIFVLLGLFGIFQLVVSLLASKKPNHSTPSVAIDTTP
jgi:uncharacterized membrane protein YhaH (DUF805 family)